MKSIFQMIFSRNKIEKSEKLDNSTKNSEETSSAIKIIGFTTIGQVQYPVFLKSNILNYLYNFGFSNSKAEKVLIDQYINNKSIIVVDDSCISYHIFDVKQIEIDDVNDDIINDYINLMNKIE